MTHVYKTVKAFTLWVSCKGNVYTDDTEAENDEICPQCGDTDSYLGTFFSMADAALCMKAKGFSDEYIAKITGHEVSIKPLIEEETDEKI